MSSMRRDELNRKVYGWLVRDGNAAVGCSSMWADTMEGECPTPAKFLMHGRTVA